MSATILVSGIPDGASKIEINNDTKIPNAATLTIRQEDHTLGNLIKAELTKDSHVLFAGYKMWHPLEHSFLLNVQTDGIKTPEQAVLDAIDSLVKVVDDLETKFKTEFSMFEE